MNAKELENQLKPYANGAMFISLSQIGKFLGYGNIDRNVKPIVQDLEVIAINQEKKTKGRPSGRYFIPDVAKKIYGLRYWE